VSYLSYLTGCLSFFEPAKSLPHHEGCYSLVYSTVHANNQSHSILFYVYFLIHTLNSKFREPQFYVTLDQHSFSFSPSHWNARTEALDFFQDCRGPPTLTLTFTLYFFAAINILVFVNVLRAVCSTIFPRTTCLSCKHSFHGLC